MSLSLGIGLGLTMQRGSSPFGPELVTNGGFDTDTDWTKGTGWTIGSGVATKTAGSAAGLDQNTPILTFPGTYRITYDAVVTAGDLTPQLTGGGGGTNNGTTVTTSGTFSTTIVIGDLNNILRFSGNASFAGTIDNVSMREIL